MGNKFRHGLIKRESGENPERSRHCISWFKARCHWGVYPGKALRMRMLKSGDLLIFQQRFLRKTGNLYSIMKVLFCLERRAA